MHSCVKVRRLIKLSFGVVSGVGLGIRVLDGVQMPQGKGMILGDFHHHWFEWRIFTQKCIRLVHEKLTLFPYAQYIV